MNLKVLSMKLNVFGCSLELDTLGVLSFKCVQVVLCAHTLCAGCMSINQQPQRSTLRFQSKSEVKGTFSFCCFLECDLSHFLPKINLGYFRLSSKEKYTGRGNLPHLFFPPLDAVYVICGVQLFFLAMHSQQCTKLRGQW